jgi:hypothetical protein
VMEHIRLYHGGEEVVIEVYAMAWWSSGNILNFCVEGL